jgi:PAS domain S-box-containing protein
MKKTRFFYGRFKIQRWQKTVLLYALIGFAWIVFSDILAAYVGRIADLPPVQVQTIKGLFFISCTTFFLYLLLKSDHLKQKRVEEKLRQSELYFKVIFDHSPGPIWVEDFSGVKTALDNLHSSGIKDISAYIDAHPAFILECIRKVRVLDVNQAAVDLHKATNKTELLQSLPSIFSDASQEGLKQELIAIAQGKTDFEIQFSGQTLDGSPIFFVVRWAVLPGHEKTLDRVFLSATDITELNRSRIDLERSEHQHRALVENALETILLIQEEQIILANPAAYGLLGLPVERIQGSSISEFIHPEDREWVLDRYQKRLSGEDPPSQYELRMICAQKKTRWIKISAARLKWEGKPAVLLMGHDITDQKKEHQDLERTKNLMEKTFNSLRDAIFLVDPETRHIVNCNRAAEKIFGFSEQEMTGSDTRILHSDQNTYETFRSDSEARLNQGEPFHRVIPMKKKDGTAITADVTVTPVNDLLGWKKGVVSVVRDISEKIAAEKALQVSEEKYKNLLHHTNESVVVTQNNRIAFCNPQVQKMTGYPLEELIGFPFDPFIHPDDLARIKHIITSLLNKQPDSQTDVEFRIFDAENTVRWFRSNAAALEWNGQPAVLSMISDVTDQKHLEQKNREMERQMIHANKMESIGTLAGGIAHDFNNLLSAILGFSRIIQEDIPPDSPASEHIDIVISAGERAAELVKQILAFSRKKEEETHPLQLHLIVKEALKMLRSSIPPQVEIRQNIQSQGYVEMEVGQAHQMVMNLCTNAYQALPDEGGRIDISLKQQHLGTDEAARLLDLDPGDFLYFEVADNGCGIPDDEIERIFEPYYTTKEIGRGTGLGLTMVHGIVKQAGGILDVKSDVGEGTRFRVYLPLWKGDVSANGIHSEKAQLLGGKERLLIVDDEKQLLKLLKTTLESLGYRVSSFRNPVEALEEVRRSPFQFSAIITDLAMPKMTGKALSAALAETAPHIPVIICTGTIEHGIQIQSGEHGNIRGVVQKPFDREQIGRTVRKVLSECRGNSSSECATASRQST